MKDRLVELALDVLVSIPFAAFFVWLMYLWIAALLK